MGQDCWAEQVSCLLPSVLTHAEGQPGTHQVQTGTQDSSLPQPKRHLRRILSQCPPTVLLHLLRPIDSKHLIRVHRHQDATNVCLPGRQRPQCPWLLAALCVPPSPAPRSLDSCFYGDRYLDAWPWCSNSGPSHSMMMGHLLW